MSDASWGETPLRAAEAMIAADRAHGDPAIWISRLPDDAVIAAARALEEEGPRGRPLWGATVAVKDNIDAAGFDTTAACPAYRYTPSESATTVRRLTEAGALVVGKTNLDQFATGLVGVRTPYGVPRNVLDSTRVPGGSSSGSACAVAAGIVNVALGTDTAGSGRVPAAFGNIVGLKPTVGSLPTRGVVPACRSIDVVSVFARSVDEALAVAQVAAGYDDRDPYSRAAPFEHLRRSSPPASVRIAVPAALPVCAPDVEASFTAVAALFPTTPFDLTPFLEIARLLYDGPWVAERTAALRAVLAERPHTLHPTTRLILEAGLARGAADAFDAFHRLAEGRRVAARLFRSVDALLVPTAPFCPTLAELAADPIGPNSRLGTFTNFVNLCDLAAIAVPPGVTLIGPAWSEGRLAALADHVHRTFATVVGGTSLPLPPAWTPHPLASDETALFCVGAHMSGLALNHELIALGGRFVRESETAPHYRLHALGARPGMVRVASGGAAVSGEVWALPTASIGTLLARIPAPLGFGQVDLSDGPCLGFLAEAQGVAGATDITHHGGWRGWLSASALLADTHA